MSVGKSLNPYESPVIPEEVDEEPVPFVATFVMDQAGLLTSARVNTAPVPRLAGWAAVPLLFLLALLFVGIALMVGAALAFGLGALALFAVGLLQALRNYRLARHTLQLLRAHPVLGAMGRWRLSVDMNEFFVETPGGRQPFAVQNAGFLADETYRLVIWFGDNLPIVIPEHKAYATMIIHLRRWIKAANVARASHTGA